METKEQQQPMKLGNLACQERTRQRGEPMRELRRTFRTFREPQRTDRYGIVSLRARRESGRKLADAPAVLNGRTIDPQSIYDRHALARLLGFTTRTIDKALARKQLPEPSRTVGRDSYWSGTTLCEWFGVEVEA